MSQTKVLDISGKNEVPSSRFLPVVALAWRFAAPLIVVTLLLAAVSFAYPLCWIGAGVAGFLAGYVLYFFRDPNRRAPRIPGAIVCPADGRIVSVEEVADERFPEGRAWRVAIFLSIFDVHVQRAPFAGEVESVDHKAGKFLNALNDKCSEDNEHTTILFRHEGVLLGVRQIAGAIARRIVCPLKPGDQVEIGDRIGLICFGSRVEAFLPLQAEIRVKPGLRVHGGQSILGILDHQNPLKRPN